MSNHTLEDAILNFVAQAGYRPMKPRAIAQRLHLSKDQTDDLKRTVKRLVRAGKLAYGANHLVRTAPRVALASRSVAGEHWQDASATRRRNVEKPHSRRLPSHAKRLRVRPSAGPFIHH